MSSHHTTDALWPLFDQFQFEATVAGEFSARGDYAVDIGDYAGVKLHQALVGRAIGYALKETIRPTIFAREIAFF